MYFIKGDNDVQKQIEPLKSISKEYTDEIIFIYVDSNTDGNEKVLEYFGIDNKMLPMYLIYDVSNNKSPYYKLYVLTNLVQRTISVKDVNFQIINTYSNKTERLSVPCAS